MTADQERDGGLAAPEDGEDRDLGHGGRHEQAEEGGLQLGLSHLDINNVISQM